MPIADVIHEHRGPCPCCGSETAATHGRVLKEHEQIARYRVLWNVDDHSHGMAWLVALDWPQADGGISVSVEYSFEHNAFMVRDPDDYAWSPQDTFGYGTILHRDQVIGTPLAQQLFQILDEIWVNDPARF